MAKADTESQFKNDEFTRIFDEYRAKIDEITRKAERNLKPVDLTPVDEEELDVEITQEAEPEIRPPAPVRAEIARLPEKEAARIIEDAKLQAQRIIDEAEEKARKEAKKRTQAQVDKIVERTRKEAEEIVAQAKHIAEKEREGALTSSKREAEHLIKEITEKCRQETQAQSARVVAEARDEAEKMLGDVMESSREISERVAEIGKRASNTIQEFETRLKAETAELAAAIAAAQQKLDQVSAVTVEEEETSAAAASKIKELDRDLTLSVRLKGEQTKGHNGNAPLFTGQVELKALSPSFDYRYLKSLKTHLSRIPSVKYLQEYASEKEMTVLFDVREPLPLLDILKDIPWVEEIVDGADGVAMVLKRHP